MLVICGFFLLPVAGRLISGKRVRRRGGGDSGDGSCGSSCGGGG